MAEGIISKRPDYHVEFQESSDHNGELVIKGLKISRLNHGRIHFLGLIKSKSNIINVDEIVFINHKEVILYPEGKCPKPPPVGEGLNCAAEVILEQVWPRNKQDLLESKFKFEDKLRKLCQSQEAEFISYNGETGRLTFKVQHFSKYSCDVEEEEDDEEEQATAPKNSKAVKPGGLGGISMDELKKQQELQKKKLTTLRPTYFNITSPSSSSNPDQPPASFSQETEPSSYSTPWDSHAGEGDHGGCTNTFGLLNEIYDTIKENPEDLPTPSTSVSMKNTDRHEGISLGFRAPLDTPSSASGTSRLPTTRKFSMFVDQDENGSFDEAVAITPKRSRPDAPLWDSLLKDTPSCSTRRNRSRREVGFRNPDLEINGTFSSPVVRKANDHLNVPYLKNTPATPVLPIEKEQEFKEGYEDLFTSILPNARATQCKMVGAPRVCFLRSGNFITIENKLSPKGFQGIAKISGIESYSEKQELSPLSGTYRAALKSELMLQLKRGEEVLFKDYLAVMKEQLMNTNVSSSRHLLQSERIVWELCDILWPEEVTNQEEIQDHGFLLHQRNRLAQWFTDNGSFLLGDSYNDEDRSVFGLLKKGRMEESCEKALSEGSDWLAVVLASKGEDHIIDFKDFEEAFQFFPENSLDIINLWNGCLTLDELTCVKAYQMTSFDWLQYLALYLWYCEPSTVPIDQTIRNFEAAIRKIALDAEASLPQIETQSPANLCIHLLKLYSCNGYPVKKLLFPHVWTNDILDYKLSWLLMKNLEVVGYIPENEVYSQICSSFAAQLEAIEMYEWAIFVSKSNDPPEPEDDTALEKANEAKKLHELRLLEKYVESDHSNLETEVFLKMELAVDERLIYVIKGDKAAAMQRYDRMIGYFQKIGEFQKAFNVLKGYMDMHGLDIVGKKPEVYSKNVVKHLQTLYPARKRIAGWEVHGKLLVNFFKLSRVQKILTSDDTSSPDSQDYMESAVLGFMKAITIYEPQNERQRAFLLHLTLVAQKSIEIMLADEKVGLPTKNKLKDGLISFMSVSVPRDYFQGFRCFISNMILNDIYALQQM